MKIFIDTECRCHATNPDGILREFNIPFFDGKCATLIEGYIYCPPGESYVGENSEIFHGECIVPWKSYVELAAAQEQYERDMADLQEAYQEGVNSI